MMPSRIEPPGGRGSDPRAAAFGRAQPAGRSMVAGPPFIDRAAARSDPEPAGREDADRYGAREAQACAISTPLVIRRTERAPLGALLLVLAGLWIGTAVDGLSAGNPAVVPGLGSFGAYLAGALGAALGVLALDWLVGGRTVVISHGMVRVAERSLRGRRAWREPLAGYAGIHALRELRPHGAGVRTWYVVRLWHREPAKALELARAKDPALIEGHARDWARRLGMPLS